MELAAAALLTSGALATGFFGYSYLEEQRFTRVVERTEKRLTVIEEDVNVLCTEKAEEFKKAMKKYVNDQDSWMAGMPAPVNKCLPLCKTQVRN